jgi:hypothetical protein
MYTSVGFVALAMCLVNSLASPAWETDYNQARIVSQNEKKPLAVIIGSGDQGFQKLCKDGQLGEGVRKLLVNNYICVYVDASTSHGKKLAADFAILKGKGMVISDRTGSLQAFHHDGDLSAADLTKSLKRYADPNHVVKTTETAQNDRVSNYPSNGGAAPGTYYNFGPSAGARFGMGGGRSC